jgi:hypothetical protein
MLRRFENHLTRPRAGAGAVVAATLALRDELRRPPDPCRPEQAPTGDFDQGVPSSRTNEPVPEQLTK